MTFRASSMLICRRRTRPVALTLGTPSRLVTVVGVLVLVTLLLLFSELLPVILDIFTFMLPLVSNNFGYFWIGKLGIFGGNL